MANGREPDSLAKWLGRQLKEARIAAGYKTQEELALQISWDRTVYSKAESGYLAPSDSMTNALVALFPDLAGGNFAELAGVARRLSASVPLLAWFEIWLEAERQALMLRYWQPIIIPGLFQTPEYARALYPTAQAETSDEVIASLIDTRMARKEVFDKADPPDIAVVLDEAVLHRLIGSPQIMYDQLAYLAELSARPYITLQVVPADNGANAGLSGALSIASADGTPDVVYMEAIEGQTTNNLALVRKTAVVFDHLRGDALSKRQSRNLILRLADEIWKT